MPSRLGTERMSARVLAWLFSKKSDVEEEENDHTNEESRNHRSEWTNAIHTLPLSNIVGITTQIQHTVQEHNWDCGIVCLQMISTWLDIQCSKRWMLEQVGSESIWTVDLVLLLEDMRKIKSFSYVFASRLLSVDENLQDIRYYKAAYLDDRQRVLQKFQHLTSRKLPAIQIQLRVDDILDCIRHSNCVAIALVDNQVLSNKQTTHGISYTGHYIVLAGISNDRIVIHNPGVQESMSAIEVSHFERAWRAHGTDEDIVFLVKEK